MHMEPLSVSVKGVQYVGDKVEELCAHTPQKLRASFVKKEVPLCQKRLQCSLIILHQKYQTNTLLVFFSFLNVLGGMVTKTGGEGREEKEVSGCNSKDKIPCWKIDVCVCV